VKEQGGGSGTGVSPVSSEQQQEVPETHRRDARASRKLEITRFKDLGEISPKEFAQFIGKKMRLRKMESAPRAESDPIFNFYMGKNTPERKDYIMDKLGVCRT